MKYVFSFCLLLFYGATLACATEQNVSPGINQYYQDAEYQQWLSTFERSGREVYDRRQAVVQALELKPEMDIADIGAGTGFYSLLFAEQVGKSGNVYAVDITDDFVRNIKRRAAEKNLNNLHAVLSNEKDVRLDSDSIDMAFICNTYHHFEYPQTMLASIHRALRPGGTLIVIDYRKQPGTSSSWVMSHVRSDKQSVIKDIQQAGFKIYSEPDILNENYFLRFVKIGQ
ncbi:MAG: class I SAM-dependent methyltransferase [Pseudomonadota bacterium]|nr:class I SAM-dependent methyltransferase [Pseudomonadota bacterium]